MTFEITKWISAIRQKGFTSTLKHWWTSSDIKAGTLVGVDHLGNKYYQNASPKGGEVVWGRDRWVEYAVRPEEVGTLGLGNFPKEPTHIPPEWHAWIHRMTDIPPNASNSSQYYVPAVSRENDGGNGLEWQWKEHRANLTGTDHAYRPYNTAMPKIEAWNGRPVKRDEK